MIRVPHIHLFFAACTLSAALAASATADTTPPAASSAKEESAPVPIAEAVKGVKGKGQLTAKIDVETKGQKGTFTCSLFEDETPVTVANFAALARGLRKWKDPKSDQWVKRPLYDGTLCHRVIPEFMIQCGDPAGTGRGGPGYAFDDEIKGNIGFTRPGLLAMANRGLDRATGKGTNGSQFFITEKETPWLNGRHTIFGRCEPVDLEIKLARVPAPGNRPTTDVVVKKVTITRSGKKQPAVEATP